MSTMTRRIAAERRGPRRKVLGFSALLLPLLLVAGVFAAAFTSPAKHIDLSLNVAGVSCANATDIADSFGGAVEKAQKTPPDYSGVKAFGFAPPVDPHGLVALQETLKARLDQVYIKAKYAAQGTCVDNPTATIVDADGASKVLPMVDGSQPMTPVSGSESNRDARTVPVTVGTKGNESRTNSWSELNDLYGDHDWYVRCTNANLSMMWDHDVPKYMTTESKHDNRFILAVNVSSKLTDDQIRERASRDGNPNVDNLTVVRTESIINTRNLGKNRCDEFIDTRSMVRTALGKVIFDEKGEFKGIETDKGVFVDCHNLWRLPKGKPVPTPPPTKPGSPTPPPPGTTPPTSTSPPRTPPPTTTRPPQKCVPPEVENPNGKCVVPKKPGDGAGNNGNVPEPVKGTNPPAADKPEPRPADPPKTYKPPPPPADDEPEPQPTRTRTTPPREEPAPKPSDPATGCVPPPGMTDC